MPSRRTDSSGHLERQFLLRVDRNDSQDRGVWDLPVDGVMLPYGSIYYHGAPAALQDIPLGTHLHGFVLSTSSGRQSRPRLAGTIANPEIGFRRCFLLEDDFSHDANKSSLEKSTRSIWPTKKLVAHAAR